jgi:hypothetical protein
MAKQEPQIFSASEVVFLSQEVQKEYHPGVWLPARPKPYDHGLLSPWHRLILAWKVFSGQYDALDWEDNS